MARESLPQVAGPEHLTDVLRRSGVLGSGEVRSVEVKSAHPQLVSQVIRLGLTYDGAADGPASIILKTGLTKCDGSVSKTGRFEVEFYRRLAGGEPVRFVPRCFDAAFDPDTKAWHLLFEDLTDTHDVATEPPLPPTREQCERILTTLARFHAGWWDDARLGVSIGTWLEISAEPFSPRFVKLYESFADRLADRLSPERRGIYERFIESASSLLERYRTHRNLCVIHGDAHVWNFLLPRDSGDDVRIIDWGGWRVGLAANDLAYMMATHWYPDRRREMERPLLDHYHEVLVASGVRDYARAALDEDYRLSVLWQLVTPVWQATIGLPPRIWWSHLERVLLAIEDLGCGSLLR